MTTALSKVALETCRVESYVLSTSSVVGTRQQRIALRIATA